MGYAAIAALLIGVVAYDIAAVQSPFSVLYSDAWEHAAALRMLISDPVHPAMPHLGVDGPSARFIPPYVGAALLARSAGWDGPETLLYFGLCTVFLTVISVYVFARVMFRSESAPVFLLGILYFGWGTGVVWSNSTALSALPFVAGYPSSFVFALTWLLWTLVVLLLRRRTMRSDLFIYVGIAGLVWLMAVSHLPTTLFALVGAFFLLLSTRSSFLCKAFVISAIALGVLTVEVWPYYSVGKMLFGSPPISGEQVQTIFRDGAIEPQPALDEGAMVQGASKQAAPAVDRFSGGARIGQHPFYQWKALIAGYGIGILGGVLALFSLHSSALRPFSFGFLLFFGMYLLHPVVGFPMGHRTLLFAGTFAHVVLAGWLLGQWERYCGAAADLRGSRRMAAVGFLAIVGLSVALSLSVTAYKLRPTTPISAAVATGDRTEWLALFRWADQHLGESSVVIAAGGMSWALPAIDGRVIALLHPSPFYVDRANGAGALRTVFGRSADTAAKANLAYAWGAEFFLGTKAQIRRLTDSGLATDVKIYHGFALGSVVPARADVGQ
jgi:hypothetical protein